MIEINDGKQLEAWLNDQPREVAIAIGVRAALRVAPLAADWVEVNPAEHFTDLILPLFRATASPWFTGTWPNQSAAIIASASAASFASAADSAASFAAADDDPTIWAADSTIWVAVTADATAIESSNNAGEMIRLPLWAEGVPGLIGERWARLKALLLALDEDWEVWTAWYEDRLYSAARPLIEKLELARVLIADEDWDKGAKHVNGLIAELEADFRATPPPQRPAIIQVAYGEDDKLHLVPPSPPSARNAVQANRQRAAWATHSEQLAGLENLNPGRNSPAFGHALQCYRDALGESFETLNIIALGVHGARLDAYAARADDSFLEDAASEIVALAAAHGLFIPQFPEWLAYVDDASGDPTVEMVEAAANAVRSIKDAPEIIGEDVEKAATLIAEAAAPPLTADPANRPPAIVERELLRSVGNIASAILQPFVAYARQVITASKNGTLAGVKLSAKYAALAYAIDFVGSDYLLKLAALLPGEFGWIEPVLTLLRIVQNL